MANVTIDAAALRAVLEGPDGPVAREVTRRTIALRNIVVQETPVAKGELRRNWNVRYENTPKGVTGVIANSTQHIWPLIDGARPHVIEPHTARVLAFRVGGKTVFARRVHHPGNQPNHFIEQALARFRSL